MSKLKVAVQDLLAELRIGPAELKVMAKGYSPDYPGAPFDKYLSRSADCCKIQLSQVVARKLVKAGVLEGPCPKCDNTGRVDEGPCPDAPSILPICD